MLVFAVKVDHDIFVEEMEISLARQKFGYEDRSSGTKSCWLLFIVYFVGDIYFYFLFFIFRILIFGRRL